MINFYNHFIPRFSLLLQPLYAMLKPSKRGQPVALSWTEEAGTAFLAAKQALIHATALSFLVSDAETSIATDASNTGVGAVL